MEIPLQFHEFNHLNHVEKCKKYTEILHKLDLIQWNDLDALYTDLENLQGASNIRLRCLEDEIKILSEWCDKKERILKNDIIETDVLGTKRSRPGVTDENKVQKKQKLEETSSKNATSSKLRSKGKVNSSDNGESDKLVSSKPRLTYDTPNKFWGYIEPYCADITTDDIKLLEDSTTCKIDINDYYKIPPLGRHYSEIWAKEDFIEEQQQSSKIDKKRNGPIAVTENIEEKFLNVEPNTLSNENEREICPYGTFTQRLIAALVDENIMAPMTENELQDVIQIDDTFKEKRERKSANSINAKSLENAIKEELFSLGLIDSTTEEESDFDFDDEILAELKKCQSELKALRSHNKQSINKLITKAKTAMKTQEVRQKAKVLDAEVVDIFRRFTSSKSKKKAFSRKDRETAWKAIRERETLWKLVDSTESEQTLGN